MVPVITEIAALRLSLSYAFQQVVSFNIVLTSIFSAAWYSIILKIKPLYPNIIFVQIIEKSVY